MDDDHLSAHLPFFIMEEQELMTHQVYFLLIHERMRVFLFIKKYYGLINYDTFTRKKMEEEEEEWLILVASAVTFFVMSSFDTRKLVGASGLPTGWNFISDF